MRQRSEAAQTRDRPNPPARRVEIAEARLPWQFEEFAILIGEYVEWYRMRYPDLVEAIERHVRTASVDEEAAELRTAHAPPHGPVLFALVDAAVAGGIALRRLDGDACEMRRLFVRTPFQGLGLGRRLCEALIAAARRRGFRTMRLTTGVKQPEAQALYRSLGFAPIGAYFDAPADLRPHMLFMERAL